MTHQRKSVRAVSTGLVPTMVLMIALCCTSAVCIPATVHRTFENRHEFSAIPQVHSAGKQIGSVLPGSTAGRGSPSRIMAEAYPKYKLTDQEHPPSRASQMKFTLTMVEEGRAYENADQAHTFSPGPGAVDTAATTPAGRPHIMPSALPVQILRSPLANGETAPSMGQLNRAPSLSPSRQRKQLVTPSYRAAGQLEAQEGSQQTAVEVTPAEATGGASSSEGLPSEEGNYGPILSSGVIASFAVALVFATLLLILVLTEACTMFCSYMKHRRTRAARDAKGADSSNEPMHGDFRDTAADV
ncbi:hypothetical protein, conserved [Leishmania tarentolae]|uniref:Uncharacterized protein n=1 Tax=Leishmania tarentolae TaxID=5689 RepID=A0A640KMC7_LEITA|nr:hypothetical protein, conserved [Leishmania tarentolae]